MSKKPQTGQRNEETARLFAIIGSGQADLGNLRDAADAYIAAVNLGLDEADYLSNFAVDLVKQWGASHLALKVWGVALHKRPGDEDIWHHVISIGSRRSALPPATVMQLLTTPPEERLVLLEAATGPLRHDVIEIKEEILAVLTGANISPDDAVSATSQVHDADMTPAETEAAQEKTSLDEQEGFLSTVVSQAAIMARLDRLESLVQQLVIAQLTGQNLRPDQVPNLSGPTSPPVGAETAAGPVPIDLAKLRNIKDDKTLSSYPSLEAETVRSSSGA